MEQITATQTDETRCPMCGNPADLTSYVGPLGGSRVRCSACNGSWPQRKSNGTDSARTRHQQAPNSITGQAATASAKDLGQAQLTREHTEDRNMVIQKAYNGAGYIVTADGRILWLMVAR